MGRRSASTLTSVLGVVLSVLGASVAVLAQQADQDRAPIQVPKPPPLPNRANERLPEWLRVRSEFRERMEGFTGSGFAADRDDLCWLTRFRFDVAVALSRGLTVHVQSQDARVARKDVGPTSGAPFRDAFDLRMAYADVGDPEKGPFSLRVGRQELAFGEQRLVGHVSWLNTARTFDGVRATVRRSGWRVDAFGTSTVRIQDGAFNRSGNGNRFFGANATTTRLVPNSTIEPYVFWRGDRALTTELGALGDLRVATIGVRWVGRLPARFDYGTEVAAQTGSLGSDDVHAWAGHWVAGHTIGGPFGVRVVGELNVASGDRDPSDGQRQTFDQLYPTGHDKYGLADQVGWRNIRHVRAGVEATPHPGWSMNAGYHSWWLADAHDGLYSAAGSLVARVRGGAANRHVGQEVDMQAAHSLSRQLQVSGGYASVFPGAFLKEATPGAAYRYAFVMVTYVFLAEK